MKKILMLVAVLPFICMAGNLIIEFNDATPNSEFNFDQIDYIEIMPSGFIAVTPGSFEMGQTGVAEPVHTVNITRKFLLGINEVTQKEWSDIMGDNPSGGYGIGDNYPVYRVNCYLILKYCNLRSMTEGLTPCYTINGTTDPAHWGSLMPNDFNPAWDEAVCDFSAKGYRLPTEAEWEFGARYNDERTYPWGETAPADTLCNYGNIIGSTTVVGSYTSGKSRLGNYDMSGNVFEWVWDFYEEYSGTEETDPSGPVSLVGGRRIIRGGGFNSDVLDNVLKSASRQSAFPYKTYNYTDQFGFRLARTK